MRADVYLVEQGLFESRAKARAAIEAGGVSANGKTLTKASQKIPKGAEIKSVAAFPWVCRAGMKLDHALKTFDVDIASKTALDIGASTGGFTEVLLSLGATKVYAVDVGTDQLHAKLNGHPKVVSLEQTDARTLTRDDIPDAPEILVCDASFIGLAKVLDRPLSLLAQASDVVTLVKPQFEVGKIHVGRGGIVNSSWAKIGAVQSVIDWLADQGFETLDKTGSPIEGGSGNTEYLLHARRASP